MAKEGLLGALGRFAANFAEAAPDGPRNAWTAIGPWVADLTRSASQHWLPHLLTGIPCEVFFRDSASGLGMSCPSPAIAACSVCRKPTCLNHAFVARSGQAVCFPCVKQDIDDHAPKIPWPSGTRGNPAPGAPPGGEEPASRYEPGQHAPPSPPPDVRVSAARKVLKIKRNASWAQVEAAYKALLVKHHPDLNPQDRARAEARFKEVRVAYDFLKKYHEE